MNRRVAAGRLSEVVGASGLETDRFMRTLEYIRMVTDRERLEAEGAQRLTLTPRK